MGLFWMEIGAGTSAECGVGQCGCEFGAAVGYAAAELYRVRGSGGAISRWDAPMVILGSAEWRGVRDPAECRALKPNGIMRSGPKRGLCAIPMSVEISSEKTHLQ